MTTITFANGYMAADTQISINNYKTKTEKLYTIEGFGVIGLAGSAKLCLQIAQWWQDGCEGEAPEVDDNNTVQGILSTKDGLYYLEDGSVPLIIKAPYLAIGSGSDFAFGALGMGKSAEEAVREAMRHDIYTGGDVDVIDCSLYYEAEGKPKYSKKQAKKAKKK